MTNNELSDLLDKEYFYIIPGYNKLYLMDKLGRVLSLKSKKILKPVLYTEQRLVYSLYKNKKVERHTAYEWYSRTFGTIEYRRRKACQTY